MHRVNTVGVTPTSRVKFQGSLPRQQPSLSYKWPWEATTSESKGCLSTTFYLSVVQHRTQLLPVPGPKAEVTKAAYVHGFNLILLHSLEELQIRMTPQQT